MPLELLPMKASDVEAWTKLTYFTFRQTIGRIIWTREPSAETLARMEQANLKQLQTPDTVHHKIVDTDIDPEAPIAHASWHIYRNERTIEEVEADCVIPYIAPEKNKEAVVTFWSGLFSKRKEMVGTRPHIYCELLETHPNHQKRGAGSMLVQWIADEADRLGLECFIEASPPGRILYSKFGFETVTTVLFKGAPFGVPDVDELTSFMIRKPQGQQTN